MVSAKLDIVGKEAIEDPQSYFGKLRDATPIIFDEKSQSWIITNYEYIKVALADADAFSSDRILPFLKDKLASPDLDPLLRQAFTVLSDWLVFKDAPDHMRLRTLLFKGFSPRAIKRLADKVTDIVDEVLKNAPDNGPVEFFEEIAFPITSYMMAEMLGVPVERRGKFLDWVRKVGPIVNGGLEVPDRYTSAAIAFDELLILAKELSDHYRDHPGENLISDLIRAEEDNDSLSEAEILASCTLAVFGGTETTANLICNALLALLKNPKEMLKLKNREVDIASAIEEFLRFDGSGKAVARLVKKDINFFGNEFKKGQRVFMILASANRDPLVFSDPEKLILDRELKPQHIAFSFGPHTCLGNTLARLEARIVIPKILDRWSEISLNEETELKWLDQLLARGLKKLVIDVKE